MKNWDTLQADTNLIMNKHYTAGRRGNHIKFIVLHHNGGNLSIQGCYDAWQTREASAHYQVQADGVIGQLVHDKDTAWHANNLTANLQSIGIEHADDNTNPWHISDATLDNGAHLVAALCKAYGLGAPTWGVNVFPHSHFSSTACPASLQDSQRDEYMQRAQAYYTQMTGETVQAQAPQNDNRLAVDGWCGPATITRFQQIMNTIVDGVISGQAHVNDAARPNVIVQHGRGGSQLVRAVQSYLGVASDGYWGRDTTIAMQKHLGVAVDGMFGPASVTALQNRLNANQF